MERRLSGNTDPADCMTFKRFACCTNGRGIRREVLEALILDALRDRLMAPDRVAAFVEAFISEWNRALAETSAGRDESVRELAKVERKLKGLIDAIADGFRAKGLQGQLDELETRREALAASLDAPAPVYSRACIRIWPRCIATRSRACTRR